MDKEHRRVTYTAFDPRTGTTETKHGPFEPDPATAEALTRILKGDAARGPDLLYDASKGTLEARGGDKGQTWKVTVSVPPDLRLEVIERKVLKLWDTRGVPFRAQGQAAFVARLSGGKTEFASFLFYPSGEPSEGGYIFHVVAPKSHETSTGREGLQGFIDEVYLNLLSQEAYRSGVKTVIVSEGKELKAYGPDRHGYYEITSGSGPSTLFFHPETKAIRFGQNWREAGDEMKIESGSLLEGSMTVRWTPDPKDPDKYALYRIDFQFGNANPRGGYTVTTLHDGITQKPPPPPGQQ